MPNGNYGTAMQPAQSADQSALPDHARDYFEQRRAKDLQSRHEHPELYAQLDRIEAKLDHLLAQKRD